MPGRYNEILAGRFNRGLQKLFQMKGGPPVPQLGSDISATIDVDTFLALEHRILMSVRSFARTVAIAAGGAGLFGAYRLRNPVGSNVVAVIEKFSIITRSAVSDQPKILRGPVGTGDLASSDAGNNSVRDVRMGAINSALVASDATIAVGAEVGVPIIQVSVGPNSQAEGIVLPTQEIVLAPSDVISVYSSVANQELAINLMWRERALEESELANLL